MDGAYPVTKIRLGKGDRPTAGPNAWRTQITGYGIEKRKRYILDVHFKLDSNWDINSSAVGLLWQLKAEPFSDRSQAPNPSLQLQLKGDKLMIVALYPSTAHEQWDSGQINWTSNQYESFEFLKKDKTIIPGRYYRVQLIFRADERPRERGGEGFISASINDEPWLQGNAPTLQPDRATDHILKWGWYQWGVEPQQDRVIFYRRMRLYEWP